VRAARAHRGCRCRPVRAWEAPCQAADRDSVGPTATSLRPDDRAMRFSRAAGRARKARLVLEPRFRQDAEQRRRRGSRPARRGAALLGCGRGGRGEVAAEELRADGGHGRRRRDGRAVELGPPPRQSLLRRRRRRQWRRRRRQHGVGREGRNERGGCGSGGARGTAWGMRPAAAAAARDQDAAAAARSAASAARIRCPGDGRASAGGCARWRRAIL
jgi:hypothetical protein